MTARRIIIATLALSFAVAPLAASAQTYVRISVGGPGYYVRYGNAPRRWHPRYRPAVYRRPVMYRPVAYPGGYAAAYGRAPGGWYGWRRHGRRWHHRRRHERRWMYY